jgi:hypothetical protein
MLQERGSSRENDAWGQVMLGAGRGGGDGAVARLGLGNEADSRRFGVQPE